MLRTELKEHGTYPSVHIKNEINWRYALDNEKKLRVIIIIIVSVVLVKWEGKWFLHNVGLCFLPKLMESGYFLVTLILYDSFSNVALHLIVSIAFSGLVFL